MRMTCVAVSLLMGVVGTARDAAALGPDGPIRPESRVWITGASNIRRFTCRAREVSGALALHANPTRTALLSGDNRASEPSLRVDVDRIDCGIGAMNRHLREALHGAANPRIEFLLGTYEVDLAAPAPVARVAGRVTIGGVERPVTVAAAVRVDSLGRLHVQGNYVVSMRDFGVAPPHRFGGLLRVRDRITVHFDVTPEPDRHAVDGIRCSLADR